MNKQLKQAKKLWQQLEEKAEKKHPMYVYNDDGSKATVRRTEPETGEEFIEGVLTPLGQMLVDNVETLEEIEQKIDEVGL